MSGRGFVCVAPAKRDPVRCPLRYYFPTYENDALLCTLSDSDDGAGDGEAGDVPVIAEDVSELRALKQTSVLRQLLKTSRTRPGSGSPC